jgi:hypothetical protein
MSHPLISRNADLQRLVDENYEAHIRQGHLLISCIPYVNEQRQICHGTLVTDLELSGTKTVPPKQHVVHFIGTHPCDRDGRILTTIQNSNQTRELVKGLTINCSFSNKPKDGYPDYFAKMTRYINIISHQAISLDERQTAQTGHRIASTDEVGVFQYMDTNTTRAEIGVLAEKLKNHRVAIVGLGGTGGYILDLLAKCPVAEIHLWDGDSFQSHNAFRAPGAAALTELDAMPMKVDYFSGIYSRMHRHVIPHREYVTSETLSQLGALDFVFIAIDRGAARRLIVDFLCAHRTPFIDVGMFLEIRGDSLAGTVRTTTITPAKHDHIAARLPFSDGEANDYRKNIQLADLNMFNASMAVIRWKKHVGYYVDEEREHHAVYVMPWSELRNAEQLSA